METTQALSVPLSLLKNIIASKLSLIKSLNKYLLASGLQKVLSLIFFVLMARHYGPTEVGVFSYAFAIGSIISILISGGFDSRAIRDISQNIIPAQEFVNKSLSISFVIAVAICLVFTPVDFLTTGSFQNSIIRILLLLALMTESFSIILGSFMRALIIFKYEPISYLFLGIGQILVIFFAKTFNLPFIVFILILLPAYLSRFFYLLFYLNKEKGIFKNFRFNIDHIFLKGSLYFLGVALIVTFGSNITRIMIGNTLSNEELGFYSAAEKILSVVLLVYSNIDLVLYPYISKRYISSTIEFGKFFYRLLTIFLIVSFCIGLLLYFSSSDMMDILYSKKFASSKEILISLLPYITFSILGFLLGRTLMIVGKEKMLMFLLFTVTLMQSILSYVGIKYFGVMAIPVVLFLTVVITQMSIFLIIKRKLFGAIKTKILFFSIYSLLIIISLTLFFHVLKR